MADLIHDMKIYAVFIKMSYNNSFQLNQNVTNSYGKLKQIDHQIVSSHIGANGTILILI